MKRFSRVSALLLAALLLLCSLTACGGSGTADDDRIPAPSEQLYVTDLAEILAPATESQIVNRVTDLKAKCGAEIAVVTVDFLPMGMDSEEFACAVLNQWGVGDADRNNGVVLALIPGEAKGWITAGYGIEDSLTAGRLQTILDVYLWNDFDAGNYDRAVQRTVDQVIGWFESYYGISVSAGQNVQPLQAEPSFGGGSGETNEMSAGEALILLIVFIYILSRVFRGNGGFFFLPFFFGGHGPRGGGYGGGNFHSSGGGGFSGGGSFGGGGGRGGGAGRR